VLLQVTLKFRSGRQVCQLARNKLGLKNWANVSGVFSPVFTPIWPGDSGQYCRLAHDKLGLKNRANVGYRNEAGRLDYPVHYLKPY
jgi:hypothetical protein